MMRPYRPAGLGCGCEQSSVASQRGLGAIVPLESGMEDAGVMLGDIQLADTMISPGAITSALEDINAHSVHLNDDIHTRVAAIVESAEGQRFYNDWISWYSSQWQPFFVQNHSGFGFSTQVDYVSGTLVARIRRFAADYNAFERRFRDITGDDPSYNPDPRSDQILPTEVWVGIGIGAFVLTLGAIAWTTSSVAKFAPVMRGVRGARRRRR